MDNIIMLGILAFLGMVIFYKASITNTKDTFFNLDNTLAMRGFWCLVIVLVHVPLEHGNRIQDLIGSFAYIGVTFFFMTSSYGLTLSMSKKPEAIAVFWRKRLPKLIITCWVINIVFSLIFGIFYGKFSIMSLVSIGKWVQWLIVCYFFFWLAHILIKNTKIQNILTCILVVLFSYTVNKLRTLGIYNDTAWVTECYGFVWGIVLAVLRLRFYEYFEKKWFIKLLLFGVISAILGVCYLKFKTVPFGGDYLLRIILGLSITIFILISNVKIRYSNALSRFLGNISFEIYFVHNKAFIIVDKVAGTVLTSAEYILVGMIFTVVLAYLSHIIINQIMRYVNKALKIS